MPPDRTQHGARAKSWLFVLTLGVACNTGADEPAARPAPVTTQNAAPIRATPDERTPSGASTPEPSPPTQRDVPTRPTAEPATAAPATAAQPKSARVDVHGEHAVQGVARDVKTPAQSDATKAQQALRSAKPIESHHTPLPSSPATLAKPASANGASQAQTNPPAAPSRLPADARAPEPAPVAKSRPAPSPAQEKPKTRVTVPRTDRVHASIPAGLQALLDDDPRMQPWVNRVISVADTCYRKASGTGSASAGTIQLRITMHETARPEVDVEALPSQLSAVVACATGELMRTRMPLFTSSEGERHRISLHFE